MSDEVKEWVIEWFISSSELKAEDIAGKCGEDYLQQGWIDSFQFINLISDAESRFSIVFSNDEFRDTNFSSIDGLTAIIRGKLNG